MKAIDEIIFADKYFVQYKIKGNEIIPKRCPICNGGRKGDKETFALNIDKHTFNCLRGSCGASGTFHELCKEYGERAEYMSEFRKGKFDNFIPKKEYVKPKEKLIKVSDKAIDYIKLRGITDETIKHFDIKSDPKGNIVFPYYDENKEHVLNKFRISRKFIKGQDNTKTWQEGGGKPVLFGMDKADTSKPIIITEGEFDCCSVYEAGYKNVVSIPFGTNNTEWINECWNFLDKCKDIILWFDSDAAGKKATEEVSKKLGIYKCKIIKPNEKDANLILHKYGKEKVKEYIEKAEIIPMENLTVLADCKYTETERILFGNRFIDYYLGGCRMGDLTVWTGKRGSGKSTVLNQTIADTVEQDYKTFLYTGELSNSKAKQWLDRQVAGEKHIVEFQDELTGRKEYGVHPKVVSKLERWYRNHIYVYGDDGNDDIEDVIEVMQYAYRRYNVKRFILDNLKTMKTTSGKDSNAKQGNIMNALRKFVKTFDVHVDLVVHPRKTIKEELEDEDVGGSSDIIDLAHNIIVVQRIYKDKLDDKDDEIYHNNDLILNIKKNREYGDVDKKGFFRFNIKSKRIFDEKGMKTYGWEKIKEDIPEELQMPKITSDDCPF